MDTPSATDRPQVEAPVARLLERIARPAASPVPDLATIGTALVDLGQDLDFLEPWIERLGATSGLVRIHAPARGPRLALVHRLEGQMSAVHDHGTWVALAPVTGLETHRRYRLRGAGATARPAVADHRSVGPAEAVTLLPPDDLHDHGHLAGHGEAAYVLILTGDDQTRFERHEWDLESGRHRVLRPGEAGRWLATEPMP